MKIGFLLNNLSGGGAERVAVVVANTLASEGHNVTLILNRLEGAYLADVRPNIAVVSLGARMLWALPKLLGVLRKEKFDGVYTILDQPTLAALMLRPLIRPTKVVVVECNNPRLSEDTVRNPIWWTIRRLRPWLYPRADHIVAKSHGIQKALVEAFRCSPEKISVIPNPIDFERIATLSTQVSDHPWILKKEEPLIVAVGRLNPQKDYPTLLRAFARVRRDKPARLIILGEGEQREHLLQLAAELQILEAVDLHGFVANPFSYVASADVYVMSSRWEGWPNALVEALACGTPVVSTDCDSGPREILEGGSHGLLVPVGDVDALAVSILMTLDAKVDHEELKRHVMGFTPESAAARYLRAVA